ncbi:MAG: hypothetical protein HN368_14430, partial [Spirochaetales bacterium]|nr:hypothetical protein [Spirochaetales bacterium]
YDLGALLAEKERLIALLLEREEAIAAPERDGNELSAAGSVFQAAVRYLESAVAAVGSDVDNAGISFERVLTKASQAAGSIGLESISFPAKAQVGAAFDGDFRIRVVGPQGELPDVPVLVTWVEVKPGGRKGVSTELLRSSRTGEVAFSHPPPEFSGNGSVLFSLSFLPQLESLFAVREKQSDLVRGFEEVVSRNVLELRYQVVSTSASIPTGVYIRDFLIDGSTDSRPRTALGVEKILAAQGFTLVNMNEQDISLNIDTPALLAHLRRRLPNGPEQLIFGESRIVESRIDDGVYILRIEGVIKTADVQSGRIIHSAESFKTARGRSESAAASAGFAQLGELFGTILARELP